MKACLAVLAHNEERRIASCLASLAPQAGEAEVHVVVNGSTDRTAAIARGFADRLPNLTVHDWPEGGKTRSWNRLVFDTLADDYDVYFFVDGDAIVAPGSLPAMIALNGSQPEVNAVAALPLNGRNCRSYQEAMRRERFFFGDLYLLDGGFVARMRVEGLRLPEDTVGDDGLLAALARTDLQGDAGWNSERVAVCEAAGFRAEEVSWRRPATLLMQYKRMRNYSVRHFQNRIISDIMRREGPRGLPTRLADLYGRYLPGFRLRRHPLQAYFDLLALRRLKRLAGEAKR